MGYFRFTGQPDAGRVASGQGGVSSGKIVDGVAGKSIIICDMLVETGTGSLGTSANGGNLLAYFVAGSINLSAPIKAPEGASLYINGSSKMTITYYLED
jgi:hypothetical protein